MVDLEHVNVIEGQQGNRIRKNKTNQEEKIEVDQTKIEQENDELISKFEIIWKSEMKRKKKRLEEENKGKNNQKTNRLIEVIKRCKVDAVLLNEINTKWKKASKGIIERMIKKIGREVKMKTADSKE